MVERKHYSGLIVPESERTDGVKCRACGCRDSRVGKSEKIGDSVCRIRYCRNCGEPFHTVEAFAAQGKKRETTSQKGELENDR